MSAEGLKPRSGYPHGLPVSHRSATCSRVSRGSGGLYNQVHLTWRGMSHVRAILYVNMSGVSQRGPPSNGASLAPRNQGHEYIVSHRQAERAYEAARRMRWALAHECAATSSASDALTRVADSTTADADRATAEPDARASVASACRRLVASGKRSSLLPVLQYATRLPMEWCQEAHALRKRLRHLKDPNPPSSPPAGFRLEQATDFPLRLPPANIY